MLIKLLKYDLRWIYKVVVVFYALSFIFAIIARICLLLDNSMLFWVLGQISAGVMVSMLVSSLINGMMRSWGRFVINVYKDESYLTHTLPIEKKTIYLSKVLAAIICAFITVVVAIICLFICYYSKENIDILKQSLQLAADTYNTTVINLLLVISFILFLEVIFIILIGYVGIIIGHKTNKNKMVKSIIVGFGLYIITTILSLLIISAIGLFNKDIMNLIDTADVISIKAIKTIMYIAIVIYLSYNTIYYFIGKKQLEKGVNIE